MNLLLSAIRQIELPAGATLAPPDAEEPNSKAQAMLFDRPRNEFAKNPVVEWPLKLMEDQDLSRSKSSRAPRTQQRSQDIASAPVAPVAPIAAVGVVTAAALPDPDVFVCLSTLDSMLESAILGGDSPPWPSETIDLSPATAMDLRKAAREASRRSRTPQAESSTAGVKASPSPAPSSLAAALESASEQTPSAAPARPGRGATSGARRVNSLLAEQTPAPPPPAPLVNPGPLPRRGRDFIHKAMEKHLASEGLLAAAPSPPPAVEPQTPPSGAEIVDQTWAASLVENAETAPAAREASKRDSGMLALPAQDLDRRSRYWKIAKRLMAPRNDYRAKSGVMVLFVAAGRVGAYEFSLIEMARASLEAVTGRVLLVTLDGSTEFMSGAPAALPLGVVDVWRGAASWADAIRSTSDPRIDLVPWGSSAPLPAAGLSCEELRSDYSLILLAGGGKIAGAAEQLASKVDDVLMVVALGNTRTEVALGMSSRLASLRAPLTGCIVVGAAD